MEGDREAGRQGGRQGRRDGGTEGRKVGGTEGRRDAEREREIVLSILWIKTVAYAQPIYEVYC